MDNRVIDEKIIEPSIDPKTKKIAVRSLFAHNDGGTRTEIRIRDFPVLATDEPSSLGGTNTAPSPLETALASLVGCDGVIINGVAKAMGFSYESVDFKCESEIDVRGPKGVPGIRPFFQRCGLDIIVTSDESDARFEQLIKNVEFRCPVMNLFRSAGVEMEVNWSIQPTNGLSKNT